MNVKRIGQDQPSTRITDLESKEEIANANAKERKERGAENQAWRRREKILNWTGVTC
jgi:hypothetical protein